MTSKVSPPLARHWSRAGYDPLEVRPTSRVSLQVAVGRTSFDRLRLGTRQAVQKQIPGFSAAFLGQSHAEDPKGSPLTPPAGEEAESPESHPRNQGGCPPHPPPP